MIVIRLLWGLVALLLLQEVQAAASPEADHSALRDHPDKAHAKFDVLSGMDSETFDSLIKLTITFERDEDWVAVGHVAYLLDKFPYPSDTMARVSTAQISTALH